MTDKEKADCLIELHKEQSLKHKQLIDLEFKVNISLWTFIVLAGYFILKDILPNHHGDRALTLAIGYLVLSFVIIIVHYNSWMFPITRSQMVSDYFIKSYLCKIEQMAGYTISTNALSSKPEIKKFSQLAPNYKNWIILEVGITAFLLFIVFIFGLVEAI